ncbi:MAG: hypothetical protein WAL42_06700, partial [Nitrososphaeraceae archaeon]
PRSKPCIENKSGQIFSNQSRYNNVTKIMVAATYRCQGCKSIFQLIEISTAKRKTIYCPYCGKRMIEPTNIILY